MLKKSFLGVLILSLFVALVPSAVLAKQPENTVETVQLDDGYELITKQNDNTVTVEMYNDDNILENYTTVDKDTGTVTIVDEKGNEVITHISDYVGVADLSEESNLEENDPQFINEFNLTPQNVISPMALYTEPVDNTGLTRSQWDNDYNEEYYYLGSASVYYFNDPGYLYRKIDSMTKHETYQFTFTAGTAVSTVVGILLSVFTGGTWTAAVVMGLIATSSGVLTDYFRGTFDYRTYHYLYKVRVNGKVHFNTYRNISYWVSYNDSTESISFTQKSFNDGFSPSNLYMVQAGIDNYILAN